MSVIYLSPNICEKSSTCCRSYVEIKCGVEIYLTKGQEWVKIQTRNLIISFISVWWYTVKFLLGRARACVETVA